MAYKLIKIKEQIGYQDALDLQMKVFDLVDRNIIDGCLLILEHKPVLTMGIRTEQNNLLVSEEHLKHQGVELFKVDRGGDITFHGPGQIVAYPILRFRDFKLRLSDYMHKLEECVIDTLSEYSLKGYSKKRVSWCMG
jgi:lipoyl(octanoyl) transferase